MRLAQEHARRFEQQYVGTEHVLLALLEDDPFARRTLETRRITVEQVDTEIERLVGAASHKPAEAPDALPISPRLNRALQRTAADLHLLELNTSHLLYALAADPHSAAGRALVNLGIDVEELHASLRSALAA
jgi:ATP-dependent Clp protease ATP-binding subunit ClpC